jgi:hypothetical protein
LKPASVGLECHKQFVRGILPALLVVFYASKRQISFALASLKFQKVKICTVTVDTMEGGLENNNGLNNTKSQRKTISILAMRNMNH